MFSVARISRYTVSHQYSPKFYCDNHMYIGTSYNQCLIYLCSDEEGFRKILKCIN